MVAARRIAGSFERLLYRRAGGINIGNAERLASLVGGGALLAYGLARRTPASLMLALVGGTLLYRGTVGQSALYRLLGINTGESGVSVPIHVEQVVTINRPAEELYRYWRDFENLPNFMHHLQMVRTIDDRQSHWTAKTPLGRSVDWATEITDDQPNHLIAWRSLPAADVTNAGTVRFRKAPGDQSTEVCFTLDYDPPGNALDNAVAALFEEAPEQQIIDDLFRFKRLMETGEITMSEKQVATPHPLSSELPNQGPEKRKKDIVIETSEESFPASDPPAWTASEAAAERAEDDSRQE